MSENTLSQIEKVADVETKCPPGYVRVRMSTKGLYGAPAVLHMRNFSVEEALELGSIAQEELPIKIPKLLQQTILEESADINKFYEPEVSELCIHFYSAFYSPRLKEVPYVVTEEDKKWMLENTYQGKVCPEYQNWLRGLENGQLKPKVEIDLNQVEYYNVGDTAKSMIKYTNPDFDFSCVFQYPRFGDTALMQKALKEEFRAEDARMGPLYEIFKRKRDAEARLRKGENIAIESIPYLNPDDEAAVRDYELRKTQYIITMMKGLYLKELNGVDVSDKDLSERVELAKDPRIDFSTYQTVSDTFNKLKIGPVPKVMVLNPVSGIPQEIDHPFRPLDLLAAIKNYRPDHANIEFI